MKTCFAYYRTSTATNAESDTWERQKATCTAWAKRTGATIAGETREVFTGTEDKRPGLAKLLSEIQPGQTILVAGSDRLSRDLMVQITLLAKFTQMGVHCVDAGSGRSLTESSDPMAIALTQMQGVFAELEKSQLVAKLREARNRASAAAGKRIEGRKPRYLSRKLLDRVKALRKKPAKRKRMPWDNVSKVLFAEGHTNTRGEAIDKGIIRKNFNRVKKSKLQIH
jgi:DNA invertase Pin-like site-specific DNA recombinase